MRRHRRRRSICRSNTTWDAARPVPGRADRIGAHARRRRGAADHTIELPATLTPGIYYVIAKADWTERGRRAARRTTTRSPTREGRPRSDRSRRWRRHRPRRPANRSLVTDTTKNLGAGGRRRVDDGVLSVDEHHVRCVGDVPLGIADRSCLIGGFASTCGARRSIIPAGDSRSARITCWRNPTARGAVAEYLETNNVKASGRSRSAPISP